MTRRAKCLHQTSSLSEKKFDDIIIGSKYYIDPLKTYLILKYCCRLQVYELVQCNIPKCHVPMDGMVWKKFWRSFCKNKNEFYKNIFNMHLFYILNNWSYNIWGEGEPPKPPCVRHYLWITCTIFIWTSTNGAFDNS